MLGTSVGPYRIARLLGVGGMGRVYKGVQPQIGSRVAVKVLSRECTDRKDLVERFFSEARAVNLIRHESIVNVLDLAMLPDGRPYIVMEYLDGAPLSDLVARAAERGPMPLGGTARLAVEVLDALGAAHAKGIVHRDLKPDNVFVTPAGRGKVLDFGIAKLLPELGGSFTQTGSLLGTPHYMSPEQASGKPIDFRTDLYAMGVILFECATGQKPFVGDSMFDLLRKHVDVPPPPPRSLRPDLPPAYEAVISTALAKDPNHRFASAAAMANALQQATAGMAPEQWATITGNASGAAPNPSGGWGTPASWGGAARGVAPPAITPQPPYASGAGGPSGPHGAPGAFAPYPPPAMPGVPPNLPYQTTATAGQAFPGAGAPRKSKAALWAALGLVLVGGGATAAILASRNDAPRVATSGSGSGSATGSESATGSGAGSGSSSGSAAGSGSGSADEPLTDAEPAPGSDGDPPSVPTADGDISAELRELESLLSSMPEEQRAMMREQFAMMEQQLKALPAAQRAMVAGQLRSALAMSKAQLKAAKIATSTLPALPTTPPSPQLAERDDSQDGASSGDAAGSASGGRDSQDDSLDPPRQVPLTSPLPKGWNGKRFDVDAYLPTAVAAVRKIAPDAKLFRIDAEGVLPDGSVDLSQGSAIYRFISAARAARPASVPLGAKWDPKCQLNVWVEASGIDVREWTGCKEKPVPMPRCSLKARWQKMMAKGAPGSNAIAEIGYRAGVIDGRPIWFFDIGDAFDDGPSPDDC